MRVSVQASALLAAGYPSLLEGLDALGARRVELALTPACEAPRLDGGGWASVADEGCARAYRGGLHDHAVVVSALSIASPPGEALPASILILARQAADVLGAPVVRIEGPASRGALLGLLTQVGAATEGLRAVFALPYPGAGSESGSAGLGDEDADASGNGLALEVGPLLAGGGTRGPWQALRRVAAEVRCVVCGAPAGEGGLPVGLAATGVDYARLVAILGRVGYSGALTLSLQGRETGNPELLRDDMAWLKDIVGEY
jgi:hypothetical protein